SSGGRILDTVEGDETAFYPHARLIYLIHGYNVSRSQAEASFVNFERNLRSVSAALAGRMIPDICYVFWPGDAWIHGLRTLTYPWKVGPAIRSAPLFAESIAKRRT